MTAIINLLKNISDATTVEEALEAIDANFIAEKRQVYYKINEYSEENFEQSLQLCPNEQAVVRKETEDYLGMVSDNYGIVQYKDAIDFLNTLVEQGKAKFFSGVSTDRGARVHIIMKANEYIELEDGEKIDFFFSVASSHNRSTAVSVMCTPIHNKSQVIFTPLDNGVVKFQHRRHVSRNMKSAGQVFDKMNKEWLESSSQFVSFTKTIMDDNDVKAYFLMLVDGDSTRSQNIRNKLMDIYKAGKLSSLPSCQNTLWGAFMAFQQYCDYYQIVRKSSKGRGESEARIESRLTGTAARDKARAYSFAKKLASKGRLVSF